MAVLHEAVVERDGQNEALARLMAPQAFKQLDEYRRLYPVQQVAPVPATAEPTSDPEARAIDV